MDRGNKARKAQLEKDKDIHCGRCPYHRRENGRPRAQKRSDAYKTKRKGR